MQLIEIVQCSYLFGLGPVQGQPPQGQENLRALQSAIDSMDEKGMQEDPRYSQLLALRARANGAAALSQIQMSQLRYFFYL